MEDAKNLTGLPLGDIVVVPATDALPMSTSHMASSSVRVDFEHASVLLHVVVARVADGLADEPTGRLDPFDFLVVLNFTPEDPLGRHGVNVESRRVEVLEEVVVFSQESDDSSLCLAEVRVHNAMSRIGHQHSSDIRSDISVFGDRVEGHPHRVRTDWSFVSAGGRSAGFSTTDSKSGPQPTIVIETGRNL